jgi:hypothetical protein
MHPKPTEAKPCDETSPAISAAEQCRSQWRDRNSRITEADNTNTPTHA